VPADPWFRCGRFTRPGPSPVSDLDIALDTGTPIDPATIQQITESLDELPTLRKIDLVDLQAVDQEFRKRVMREGELIHGR